jgi:hypothetical protein
MRPSFHCFQTDLSNDRGKSIGDQSSSLVGLSWFPHALCFLGSRTQCFAVILARFTTERTR